MLWLFRYSNCKSCSDPLSKIFWTVSIISKFPIINTYDYNLYGIGVDLLISNSDTIKFVSSHLTAYPYGPYDLYEGVSVEEVMNNELSTRYLENLDIYNQIINNPLNNPNLPIIYVGDHNTPSLLDWKNDNINQNFGFEIGWPVFESEDAQEGLAAFSEKRKANFKGK